MNMDKTLFENTFKDLYYCYHTAMNIDSEQYEALSESERYYLEEMVKLCKDFLKETEWVLEDA
jgi:hypothetical protein